MENKNCDMNSALDLLSKYIAQVISCEGMDFIPDSPDHQRSDQPEFTKGEILVLKDMAKKHRIET